MIIMEYREFGTENGQTLLLLPDTCCNYQTNFGSVLDALADKYHLICSPIWADRSTYRTPGRILSMQVRWGKNIKSGMKCILPIRISANLTCSMSSGCLVTTPGPPLCFRRSTPSCACRYRRELPYGEQDTTA